MDEVSNCCFGILIDFVGFVEMLPGYSYYIHTVDSWMDNGCDILRFMNLS